MRRIQCDCKRCGCRYTYQLSGSGIHRHNREATKDHCHDCGHYIFRWSRRYWKTRSRLSSWYYRFGRWTCLIRCKENPIKMGPVTIKPFPVRKERLDSHMFFDYKYDGVTDDEVKSAMDIHEDDVAQLGAEKARGDLKKF